MSNPKFHSLKVKDIRKETAESVSISLEIPESLKPEYQFVQGQYITFKKFFDGEELRRSYSICSTPFDSEIRVGIKEVPMGRFSRFANRELKPGDELEVMTPTGMFHTSLAANQKKSYLGIAAGSGITPLMSIIKTTLITEPESTFTLLYSNKNTGSVMFLEEIEALKNSYMNRLTVFHLLSREAVDVPILNGRINEEKVNEFFEKGLLKSGSIDDVFICGPEEMIMASKNSLLNHGLSEKQIHFELFTSPAQAAKNIGHKSHVQAEGESKASSKVSVKIDGITYNLDLPFDGDSVLDAALQTGADLPFACKGGVCCTCRARVISGSATMDMNFSLEDDEVEKGYILTCQAHPTSEELFVDFDQK